MKLRPPEKAFDAWKTGNGYGCLCHYDGRSVPCRSELTDGALSCDYCERRTPLDWCHWAPLVTESRQPVVICLKSYSVPPWKGLAAGRQVTVRRQPGKSSPVEVIPKLQPEPLKNLASYTVDPLAFERWLFTLWKDAALASHFGCRSAGPDRARPSPAPSAPIDNRDVRAQLVRQAAADAGVELPDDLPESAVDAALERMVQKGAQAESDRKEALRRAHQRNGNGKH